MPAPTQIAVSVIGIDIGKNSFHIVGLDQRGAIVLRQKWSRGQVDVRLANMPPCLIGMEACVGAHHLSRKLRALGHDARLMTAKYVRPYSKGQKNDFRDAEAIAEAVQRPTMKFVGPRPPISSTCRPCTESVSGWSASAPVSSIKSAPSSWSGALRCDRGNASCEWSCRGSLPGAHTSSRPETAAFACERQPPLPPPGLSGQSSEGFSAPWGRHERRPACATWRRSFG